MAEGGTRLGELPYQPPFIDIPASLGISANNFGPDHKGKIGLEELKSYTILVWALQVEGDSEKWFNRRAFFLPFRDNPGQVRESVRVKDLRNEILYQKSELRRMQAAIDANRGAGPKDLDISMKQKFVECGNYIIYKFHPNIQNRQYSYASTLEVLLENEKIIPVTASHASVMICFAQQNGNNFAVTDFFRNTSAEEGVFILNVQAKDDPPFGANVVTLPDRWLTVENYAAIQEKVLLSLPSVHDEKFDFIIYSVSSRHLGDGYAWADVIDRELRDGLQATFFALRHLKEDGVLVLRMFTLETIRWAQILYLLGCSFKYVHVMKPLTSPRTNSETFIVAGGFIADYKAFHIGSRLKDYLFDAVPHAGRMMTLANRAMLCRTLPLNWNLIPEGFIWRVIDLIVGRMQVQLKFNSRLIGMIRDGQFYSNLKPIRMWKVAAAQDFIHRHKLEARFSGIPNAFDTRWTEPDIVPRNLMIEEGAAEETFTGNWKRKGLSGDPNPDDGHDEGSEKVNEAVMLDHFEGMSLLLVPVTKKVPTAILEELGIDIMQALVQYSTQQRNDKEMNFKFQYVIATDCKSELELMHRPFEFMTNLNKCGGYEMLFEVTGKFIQMLARVSPGGSVHYNVPVGCMPFVIGTMCLMGRLFHSTTMTKHKNTGTLVSVILWDKFCGDAQERGMNVSSSLREIKYILEKLHHGEMVPTYDNWEMSHFIDTSAIKDETEKLVVL